MYFFNLDPQIILAGLKSSIKFWLYFKISLIILKVYGLSTKI